MTFELSFEYFNRHELSESPHLKTVFDLINESFRIHGIDHYASDEKNARLDHPSNLLETLNDPSSFICVGFDKGAPVTTTVVKPFHLDKRGPPDDFTVLNYTKVSEVIPMAQNVETALVTVKYQDQYLGKRLAPRTVEAALSRIQPPASLWIASTCINTGYWQKQGYTMTDEYELAKGGWNYAYDFKLHYLQKLME